MSDIFHGLRTVVYMVPDIEAAKTWYSDILGIAPYFDTPYYVGFNVGGYELGLHPEPDNTIRGNNLGAYWGVDDVAAVMNKLIASGATEHEQANDVGGGIIIASVKDPWGNIFGVIYNPHFKL